MGIDTQQQFHGLLTHILPRALSASMDRLPYSDIPQTSVDSAVDIALGVCLSALGLQLVHLVCSQIRPLRVLSDVNFVEVVETITQFVWCIMLLCFTWPAIHQLLGTQELRWDGITYPSYMTSLLYVSYEGFILVKVVWQRINGNHSGVNGGFWATFFHHAFSVNLHLWCLATHRMTFFAALPCLSEVTNLFLNPLTMGKLLVDTSPLAKHAIAPSGLGLWITFIVFRLALFPWCLYLFLGDMFFSSEQAFSTVGWVLHGREVSMIADYPLWMYPAVILFLLILSCMWFIRIHKGLMKALGGKHTEIKYE